MRMSMSKTKSSSSCDILLPVTTRIPSTSKYLPLRYKTLTAREKGAKALLIVTGSADDSTDELVPLSTITR